LVASPEAMTEALFTFVYPAGEAIVRVLNEGSYVARSESEVVEK
jgi:hypothetical protein